MAEVFRFARLVTGGELLATATLLAAEEQERHRRVVLVSFSNHGRLGVEAHMCESRRGCRAEIVEVSMPPSRNSAVTS